MSVVYGSVGDFYLAVYPLSIFQLLVDLDTFDKVTTGPSSELIHQFLTIALVPETITIKMVSNNPSLFDLRERDDISRPEEEKPQRTDPFCE